MNTSSRAWYRSTSFKVAVSVALLLLCLTLVDFNELSQALVEIKPGYLLSAFVLNAIGTVAIKAWIASMTTRASGLRLSYLELVRINLMARFYTIALPRGASMAIRWHHYQKGGSGHAAAALLLFENMVSVFTLFLSAGVILMVEYERLGATAHTLLFVSWLGVCVSAVILFPFVHKPSADLFARVLQPVLRKGGRVGAILTNLLSAIENYHSLPVRRVGSILLASLLGYIFFILSAWILAEGMGLGVGIIAIAWVRSLTLLVALVPVTIAGIGLREGMMIALLAEYGITPSVAFAYAVASFAIQLVLGLFGAILAARQVFRKSEQELADETGKETL